MANAMDVLLVTGVSGAGRGTVAKVLEDTGWYVVDNVPTQLIVSMVQVAQEQHSHRLAVVLHTRPENFLPDLAKLQKELLAMGVSAKVLFLDASDAVLVRRFEQVRRRHPMQGNGTLVEAIALERNILIPVKEHADLLVDTSILSVQGLRERIENSYAASDMDKISINVESFGFKYGLPIDADLVIDVRFLPNPYWVPELRELTGKESSVSDYVLNQPDAQQFLKKYQELLDIVLAGYAREGKRYLTLAVGCTGGKHRSVAITEQLVKILGANDSHAVRAIHRDLGRE